MFCPKYASNLSDNIGAGGACGAPMKRNVPAEASGVNAVAGAGAVSVNSKPWMRVAACAVATIAAIAIALFSLSGCGGGGGDARSGSSASESAGSSASKDAEPSVEDLVKPTVNDYTWEELSKISGEISKARDEGAAIEVAKKHNLTTEDGRLDGTQTKSVTLTDGTQTAVQIAGFAHDEKTDGGKAGITFIFKDCIGEHDMNRSTPGFNDGGWEKSEMRSYLNSEGLNLLPNDLKQKVVSVNKLTNNVGETQDVSSVTKTADQLWLFSAVELCGDRSSHWITQAYIDIQNAEGSEYKLFRDTNVNSARSNNILLKSLNGQSSSWWKRTPDLDNSYRFESVNLDGNPNYGYHAHFSYGVCPGFCI